LKRSFQFINTDLSVWVELEAVDQRAAESCMKLLLRDYEREDWQVFELISPDYRWLDEECIGYVKFNCPTCETRIEKETMNIYDVVKCPGCESRFKLSQSTFIRKLPEEIT